MKKSLLLAAGLLCFALMVDAQDLMENNLAAGRAELGVMMETGHYVMPTGDTCLMWIKEFDKAGLINRYIDHFQCGKKYIDYEYKYNEDGSLRKAYISHHSNNFQRIEMGVVKDENGRVTELAPSKQIKDHPFAQRYEYNAEGMVIRLIRMKQDLFSYVVDSTKEWDKEAEFSTTTGEEVYAEDGSLRWIVLREFEYY